MTAYGRYVAEFIGTFALVFCGTGAEKDMGKVSISYTNSIVQSGQRKYLCTLPAHIEFQLNEDEMHLLFAHGSPRKINEYLFEDREEKSMLRILQDADADIMCSVIRRNLITG